MAAASYEARAFGVRSAIPMARAVRLCPSLVIVRPDFQKYRAVSQQVFELFRTVTPLVEPLSLDEAYLDVTENAWGETLGMTVARRLKSEIRDATGLTASAGVAPNKFLAKIASGWQKPDGLTVIAPERVEHFLQGLPVDALWGVGPVTATKLRARGIEKLIDVRTADPARCARPSARSPTGCSSSRRASTIGRSSPSYEPKSSGSENTFAQRPHRPRRDPAGDRGDGARRGGVAGARELFARTVTIKVRYNDFTTITRSHTDRRPRATKTTIVRAGGGPARQDRGRPTPVRLLGVSVHNLVRCRYSRDVTRSRHEPRLPFEE